MSLRHSIVVAMIALLSSCGTPRELTEFVDVSPAGWYAPTSFRVEVEDTLAMVDLQFVLRYSDAIATDSVGLLVSTTAPDGVMWSERFTMPTPKGDSPMVVTQKIYRERVRWSQVGEYKISLLPQHLYRDISAVGLTTLEAQ